MATWVPWAHLLHPVQLRRLAQSWLEEDTPSFDYGGFVVGETREEAVILAKSPTVLAGRPFVDAIFAELDCQVDWTSTDGDHLGLPLPLEVARVRGKVRHLLLGERVALNVLTRASGVACGARRLAQMARDAGWHGRVAGTRKTTPGFRPVEKYALLVGGLDTHRNDLSSMVMLKDNHIWASGNITQAVKDARRACGFSIKIEVECRCLAEGAEAASAGADVIMFDNFTPEALHPAAAELKSRHGHVLVEASGGITAETLPQYFGQYVDIVSLSAVTQGYQTADFSMKICKQGHDPSNPRITAT